MARRLCLIVLLWVSGLAWAKDPSADYPHLQVAKGHVWLADVTDDFHLKAAGCPFVGTRLKLATGATLFRVGQLALGPKLRGILDRAIGSDQFFDSTLVMNIVDEQNRWQDYQELAGYCHGDGGGYYFESWIVPSGPKGVPDIIKRTRSFETPDFFNGLWETKENDTLTRLVWTGKGYVAHPLENSSELQKIYAWGAEPPF
jgi:hypothetical protein